MAHLFMLSMLYGPPPRIYERYEEIRQDLENRKKYEKLQTVIRTLESIGTVSKKIVPDLPRPATFKRQNLENRERLTPAKTHSTPLDRRKALNAQRSLPTLTPVSTKSETSGVSGIENQLAFNATGTLPIQVLQFGDRSMIRCTDCEKVFKHNWYLKYKVTIILHVKI